LSNINSTPSNYSYATFAYFKKTTIEIHLAIGTSLCRFFCRLWVIHAFLSKYTQC